MRFACELHTKSNFYKYIIFIAFFDSAKNKNLDSKKTAFFIKVHAYVILGIVMGLACIIPAIIAQKRWRRLKKENEQK